MKELRSLLPTQVFPESRGGQSNVETKVVSKPTTSALPPTLVQSGRKTVELKLPGSESNTAPQSPPMSEGTTWPFPNSGKASATPQIASKAPPLVPLTPALKPLAPKEGAAPKLTPIVRNDGVLTNPPQPATNTEPSPCGEISLGPVQQCVVTGPPPLEVIGAAPSPTTTVSVRKSDPVVDEHPPGLEVLGPDYFSRPVTSARASEVVAPVLAATTPPAAPVTPSGPPPLEVLRQPSNTVVQEIPPLAAVIKNDEMYVIVGIDATGETEFKGVYTKSKVMDAAGDTFADKAKTVLNLFYSTQGGNYDWVKRKDAGFCVVNPGRIPEANPNHIVAILRVIDNDNGREVAIWANEDADPVQPEPYMTYKYVMFKTNMNEINASVRLSTV